MKIIGDEIMKAVYIKEPGKIEILEKEMPVRKENEALLKVRFCGICGSDVATFTGNQPFASYPRIPGHEFSAEIVEIGDNDLGLEKGMIVTGIPYFNCGECYPCQKGKQNCCEHNETMGVHRDGSFTEYITMPVDKIVKADGLSAEKMALIEPFSISYHASQRVNLNDGDNVLVIGSGAIGLFALLSSKLKNTNVTVCDIHDLRLEYAKKLGADNVINTKKEDFIGRIMEITNGNGMDVVFEAAGQPETFLSAIDAASFGGQIGLIGNGKRETTFNHSIILKKELDIFGSRNSRKEMVDLVKLIKDNDVNILEMVSDVVDYENSIEAFKKLADNDGSTMKVLIKF